MFKFIQKILYKDKLRRDSEGFISDESDEYEDPISLSQLSDNKSLQVFKKSFLNYSQELDFKSSN